MKNKLPFGILTIAVVVLYILHFSSSPTLTSLDRNQVKNVDSLKIDSSAKVISLSDTSLLDSLEEAEFSRVGFINMFKVVDQCPTLKKDIQLLEQKQMSLQKKETQIYKDFDAYRSKKEQDLKAMQDKGLLDQMTYQMEIKQMQEKQAEAEQKVLALKPKAENLQKSQLKITQKRNNIIQNALAKINKQLKLDFVLVQDGMNTSVFPLNAKNDITNQIILVVNNQ
jgi:Skp family chaperone for outer membrane proteins